MPCLAYLSIFCGSKNIHVIFELKVLKAVHYSFLWWSLTISIFSFDLDLPITQPEVY